MTAAPLYVPGHDLLGIAHQQFACRPRDQRRNLCHLRVDIGIVSADEIPGYQQIPDAPGKPDYHQDRCEPREPSLARNLAGLGQGRVYRRRFGKCF